MDETNKNSILVVDDDHTDIMTLTYILRSEYTVYAEKHGQDAVKTAEDLLPDIILLDIIMPETDGYSVLASLKAGKKTCGIPVIFITGMGDADSKEKGLSLGAVDYIVKPFDPADVKLRVEKQIKLTRNLKKGLL